MTNASNAQRITAYFIDILPLLALVFFVHYQWFGFDEPFREYFQNRRDAEVRHAFLEQRNMIRNHTLLIWVIYSMIMDASKHQGTFGKMLMGIKVVDMNGNRINPVKALFRNLSKAISILPLFIGMFWVFFDRYNRAWHDIFAKTRVIAR